MYSEKCLRPKYLSPSPPESKYPNSVKKDQAPSINATLRTSLGFKELGLQSTQKPYVCMYVYVCIYIYLLYTMLYFMYTVFSNCFAMKIA